MRRERAPATGGDSAGTPGLLTTSSTPSSNASSSVPSRSSTPRSPSLPASTSAERSAATTWTPRPASATAAARPDRASPTTRARLGSQASSGDGSSGRVLLTTHLPPQWGARVPWGHCTRRGATEPCRLCRAWIRVRRRSSASSAEPAAHDGLITPELDLHLREPDRGERAHQLLPRRRVRLRERGSPTRRKHPRDLFRCRLECSAVRGDPPDEGGHGTVREREHRRLAHEVREPPRPHGMGLSEQLLELVHLRPDDVDPPVAHALVRSERQRTASQDQHVLPRLQVNGIEHRLR